MATHGFPAPPHGVLTPLIPLLLNKARRPSKFYKFARFKKKNHHKTYTHYLKLHSFDILMETAE